MLLSSYSPDNRVLYQDKDVTYSSRHVYGWWTINSTVVTLISFNQAWEITRYCTMHYSYVGMDLSTANACAAELKQLFTRDMIQSIWTGQNTVTYDFDELSAGKAQMADIKINKTAGCMYQVDVQVNENDSRMHYYTPGTTPYELSGYFTNENARQYYLEDAT